MNGRVRRCPCADFHGYHAAALAARDAAEALFSIIDGHRAAKNYAEADRLRAVASTLKDAADYPLCTPNRPKGSQ